jgi:hypothetical protein
MSKQKILFVIGSRNQTSQMHQISLQLPDFDCYFSQFFGDHAIMRYATDKGWLDNTIMGKGRFKREADAYLAEHGLQSDYRGEEYGHQYDMVVLCTDMVVPKIARNAKSIWVQEGMIDPLTWWGKTVKAMGIPPYWTVTTELNGTSNLADIYCTASAGFSENIAKLGTHPDRIIATGTPNYDNCHSFLNNDFEHHDYVMVATSDTRETMRSDNREVFIKKVVEIAQKKQKRLLFKLHPNENYDRAAAEIRAYAPADALLYQKGNTDFMVANCHTLITQWSTVAFTGIVLGKEVHSYFGLDYLKRVCPIQNGGQSAKHIASICRSFMDFDGTGINFLRQNRERLNREWETTTMPVLEEQL